MTDDYPLFPPSAAILLRPWEYEWVRDLLENRVVHAETGEPLGHKIVRNFRVEPISGSENEGWVRLRFRE